jgi:hypothetical protein
MVPLQLVVHGLRGEHAGGEGGEARVSKRQSGDGKASALRFRVSQAWPPVCQRTARLLYASANMGALSISSVNTSSAASHCSGRCIISTPCCMSSSISGVGHLGGCGGAQRVSHNSCSPRQAPPPPPHPCMPMLR